MGACELLHAVRREEVLLAVPPRRRAPLGALRRAPAFEGAQQPQLVRHLAAEGRVRGGGLLPLVEGLGLGFG